MKLKEFNELYVDKAVHCKTEKLANEFLKLADSLGYKWVTTHKLTSFNEWDVYKDKTCYEVDYHDKDVFFANIDDIDLPIIEFKGENKMKLKDLKQGMICKLRNKESITVVNNGVFFRRTFGIYILEEKYNEDFTHRENKQLDIMEITFGDKVVFKRNESRWFVPEYDEEYYYANDYGGISSTINMQFASDIDILNNVRVFKTREEAEKRLRQRQAALSVERWIAENDVEVDLYDTDIIKFYFTYDVEKEKIVTSSSNYRIIIPKQFILSSVEKAEQLIKEREKELKIMFGVEE